jgi:hypothetical protein
MTTTLTRCRECLATVHEPDEDGICTDCLRAAAYDFAHPCICPSPVPGTPIFGRTPCLVCFQQVTGGGA